MRRKPGDREGKVMKFGFAVSAFIAFAAAHGQQVYAQASDADYMAAIRRAAPPEVVQDATILRMAGSNMQTVQKGSNGWTCMTDQLGTPMCVDANAMEWAHAWQTHATPPDKTGFIYMLSGDKGASNTDPWAKGKTADNHWVETGSHVMIVGPTVKTMVGYPKDLSPDPNKPYVMWPGTPYEHLMLPVRQ